MQWFIDLICNHIEGSPIKEILTVEMSMMKLWTILTLALVASKSATCCSTSGMTFFAKKYTFLQVSKRPGNFGAMQINLQLQVSYVYRIHVKIVELVRME